SDHTTLISHFLRGVYRLSARRGAHIEDGFARHRVHQGHQQSCRLVLNGTISIPKKPGLQKRLDVLHAHEVVDIVARLPADIELGEPPQKVIDGDLQGVHTHAVDGARVIPFE